MEHTRMILMSKCVCRPLTYVPCLLTPHRTAEMDDAQLTALRDGTPFQSTQSGKPYMTGFVA